MDRVAGWYKRKTQLVLFILSVIFTVALNIDTILIAKTLAADDILRAAIVEQAKKIVEQPPAGVQATLSSNPGAPPASPTTSLSPTGIVVPSDDRFNRNPDRQVSMPVSWYLVQAPSPESIQTPESQKTDEEIIKETKAAKQKLVESITTLQQSGVPIGWEAEKSLPGLGDDPMWWILKLLGLAFTAIAASLGAPFWFDVLNKFITVRSAGKAPEEAPKAPKEVPTPLEPGQLPGLADALKNAILVVPGAAAQGAQQAPAQQPPAQQLPVQGP